MNTDNLWLMHGDCLEEMKKIPKGSVDMVLTDLPYGTVKGLKIDGWDNNSTSWDTVIPFNLMWSEIERVVRPNGAILLFGQEPFTSSLINSAIPSLPFSYRMIWDKGHFANPLMAKKAPLNYYEDINVFFKEHDSFFINPQRKYSKAVHDFIGKSLGEINKELGHRRAEHFFYYNSTQYALCSEETYNQLIEVFGIDKMNGFKSYIELDAEDNRFKRVFNLNGKTHFSNILKYKRPSQRFHPTQKPTELLEYLIKTYTNEGDTVLDFTAGSMSTAIACLNTNRKGIMIEKDDHYFKIGSDRVLGR